MTTATDSLAVPAVLLPQIRHELHHTLGSLSEKLSAQALDQWIETRPGQERPLPAPYRGALKHFDRTRALLDVLGWDCTVDEGDVIVNLHEHGELLYNTVVDTAEDLRESIGDDLKSATAGPREVAALIVELWSFHELLGAAMPADPDDPPSLEGGGA